MLNNINDLLNTKKFPPIIFLFGEEDFLIEENARLLFNAAVESVSSEHDSDIISGEDIDSEKLISIVSSYPFIAEKRVVMVRHFEEVFPIKATKKSTEDISFTRYLKSPQETTVLIILASNENLTGIKAATKSGSQAKIKKILTNAVFPYNTLIEKFEWLEFDKINDSDLPQWIISRIKSFHKEISHDAANLLASQTNSSLWELNNELEKLLLHCGTKKNIEENDVLAVCGFSKEYNVFELQKAVGKRNLKFAIEILENMLAVDRQEMLIMTILSKFFITLWKLLDDTTKTTNQYQLASAVGVSPYFLKEYLEALKLYKPEEIENSINELCKADEKLKSSSVDSLYIIENMLIAIMGK